MADRLAAAGHPVAAVDQRGHGQSAKPDTGYDFATLTDDLLAVLADLDWRMPGTPALGRRSELGRQRGPGAGGPPSRRHRRRWSSWMGGRWSWRDRFADWPTCEAALAPPPLDRHQRRRISNGMIRATTRIGRRAGIAGTLANVEVQPGRHHPALAVPATTT